MARRGGGRIVKEGYLTKSPPQDKAIAVSLTANGPTVLCCVVVNLLGEAYTFIQY